MRIKLPPLWLVLLLVVAFWLCLTPPVSAADVETTEPIPGASTAYDFGSSSESPEVEQDEPEESTQAEESSSPSLRSMGEDVATAEFEQQEDDSPQEENSETFIPELVDQLTEISSNVHAIRENQEFFYSQGTESVSSSSDSDCLALQSGDSSASDESATGDNDVNTDDDSSAGSYPSGDGSVASDTDLEEVTLSDIHTDLWLILLSIWGIFGIFLAFKVGGAVLGRL